MQLDEYNNIVAIVHRQTPLQSALSTRAIWLFRLCERRTDGMWYVKYEERKICKFNWISSTWQFFFLLASIFILVWFADHSVCSCAAMWCYLVERVWLFASVVTLCGLLPQDQNYFLTQHKTIIVFAAMLHQSTYAPHLIRKFNSMFMN